MLAICGKSRDGGIAGIVVSEPTKDLAINGLTCLDFHSYASKNLREP